MNTSLFKSLATGVACLSILSSCNNIAEKKVDIDELKKDTVVYLVKDNAQSPSCKFKLNYKFVTSNIENDSITDLINDRIQYFVSDGKIKGSNIQGFPTQMAKLYLKNYNRDVRELYEADLQNNIAPEEIPSWYNYTFEISTDMERGYKNCWNYEVEEFQFTGGAHPNTFARKMNIDSETGKILKKTDIFKKGTDKQICDIILRYLIKEAKEKMEEENIKDIEGLNEVGLLLDTDLFIPDNFLLKEDAIEFYYNRYEIGPYSAGDFEINVPYSELNDFIILN